MAKSKMSTAACKAKGRRLQQWVCAKISELTGIPWGPEDNKDIQSRPMGQHGVDVILRGEALEQFPFSVECKNCEKWAVQKSVEQAKANELEGTDWLLIFKKNGIKPVIIMDAEIFFEYMDLVRMSELKIIRNKHLLSHFDNQGVSNE